jgi:ATP-dependent DNA helicase DinG
LCAAVNTWLQEAENSGTTVPTEAAATVRWVSLSAMGAQFHTTPLDCAASFVQARLAKEQAWILTSATLSAAGRFEPFLRDLGLINLARTCQWESPFDYPNQALLYLPSPMPSPQAEDFPELVAELSWPLLCASMGRAFILCSTLRAVSRVAERLRELIAFDGIGMSVLEQGQIPRRTMLNRFRDEGNAILVGSASFWEGIDVRGDALSLVVIDRLPFAPPDDPMVSARSRHLKAQGLNPFRDFQLPQAITQLRQGAGRLIRGDEDKGVLVVMDERVLSRGYGKTILDSLPPFTRTRDAELAAAFVRRPGGN